MTQHCSHLVKSIKIYQNHYDQHKMSMPYHSDTVIEEGLSEDEKIKIGIHSDLSKDGQHCNRINCHDDDDHFRADADAEADTDADAEADKSPADMREEKRNISMTERGVTRTYVLRHTIF